MTSRVLYLEFLHDFTHLLQRGDARRHQGQTQYILNHSHLMEHGLDSGGIAINEEQTEQVGETVMNLPGSLILALVLQAYHLGELLGQGIANDTDDTNGSTGDHRESEGIVAADDIKGGRLVLDNLVHLFQTALASLMATMSPQSRARRTLVSALRLTPVRPGTLYNTTGNEVAAAIALKCW